MHKQLKHPLSSIFLISYLIFSHVIFANPSANNDLLRPTGQYGIGFKDLHWISDICPDPQFSEKSKNDFSLSNKRHCHELMIQIYYPTPLKTYSSTRYYQPLIISEQKTLKANTAVKPADIEQLSWIKSHTIKNAPIVHNKQFPVVFFISGLGGLTQMYENLITQLVSHGYIVVGINSFFIHGDIALPGNRIVSMVDPKSWDVVSEKTIPTLEQDIAFVYKKIHGIRQDDVFKSMDLKHIGAIGHSFGGRAIANIANQHENWFQALATLDMEVHMGSFEPESSIMPYMHIISAYWKTAFNWQNLHYPLNKNSYLVTLSPSKKDIHYSYHMNFTDLSTLQYMPAYRTFLAHSRQYPPGNYLGKGNGLKITNAFDLYLENFFNAFLKGKRNPFKRCIPITNNTFLECGPGIF